MSSTRYLYSASQTHELDRLAIENYGIPGYTLMQRAGQAIFDLLQLKYPHTSVLFVICGAGNNAGDGYVVARLAIDQGLTVRVYSLVEPETLKADARLAYLDWQQAGGEFSVDPVDDLQDADLIIDALLGTGLQRDVKGAWLEIIQQTKQLSTPVIAVDIPSGLHADTGAVLGEAIQADYTVSFIGLKKGLFTAKARDYCGEIVFNDLQVPEAVYQSVAAEAQLLDWYELNTQLTPRRRSTHKGDCGHVLIVGGNYGMCGAVTLSAAAALRAGAGLVTVITRPEHVAAITAYQPEIMVYGIVNDQVPEDILARADVIVIGPGLGRDMWGRALFQQMLAQHQPKLIDADGLYHLSTLPAEIQDAVITPHPGEAARLLDTSSADIEQDRYASIQAICREYNTVTVLKGAGTLISDGEHATEVCPYGNPGMASAGMGDVLSGLIAALMAQGYSLYDATRLGVCIHALAGDRVAENGERGMLASDLLPVIRQLVNVT